MELTVPRQAVLLGVTYSNCYVLAIGVLEMCHPASCSHHLRV
jgi:hypothetical protein